MQEANIIQQNLAQIKNLMLAYGVQKAYAFGSSVKGNMTVQSDVDFLIRFPADLDAETYSNNYFLLIDALENLLNKKVELVAEETLSNPYFIQSIDTHKMQVL